MIMITRNVKFIFQFYNFTRLLISIIFFKKKIKRNDKRSKFRIVCIDDKFEVVKVVRNKLIKSIRIILMKYLSQRDMRTKNWSKSYFTQFICLILINMYEINYYPRKIHGSNYNTDHFATNRICDWCSHRSRCHYLQTLSFTPLTLHLSINVASCTTTLTNVNEFTSDRFTVVCLSPWITSPAAAAWKCSRKMRQVAPKL